MQVWYIPAGHGHGTICLTLCRDNQHTSPPDVPTNRLEPKVKTSDKGFYKDLMYSRWSSKKDPLIRSHPYEPDRFYLHHHCDAFSTLDEFQQLLRLAQTRGRSRRFQSLKKRWMQIRYIFGMPRKAYSWQDMTGHDRTWQDMTDVINLPNLLSPTVPTQVSKASWCLPGTRDFPESNAILYAIVPAGWEQGYVKCQHRSTEFFCISIPNVEIFEIIDWV